MNKWTLLGSIHIDNKSLVIAISQSGETADTLASLKIAKKLGAHTIGIVNVYESSIARFVDEVIYTEAGSEIAVAKQNVESIVRRVFEHDDFAAGWNIERGFWATRRPWWHPPGVLLLTNKRIRTILHKNESRSSGQGAIPNRRYSPRPA